MPSLRPLFLLFLPCAALFLTPASACINGYEGEVLELMRRGDPQEIAGKIAALEAKFQREPTVATTNDLAVLHILAGHAPKAVVLLQGLEKQHPGLSRTASNLGTALELSGDNEQALKWIKEGVRRDPEDHQGTEWLHVKILEAKLAFAADPYWFKEHTTLGISFGEGKTPVPPRVLIIDFLGKPRSIEEAATAIDYQLYERLKFVTAPDPVVRDLYTSRGHIATLAGKPQAADGDYKAAAMFGIWSPTNAGDPGSNLYSNRDADTIERHRKWTWAAIAALFVVTLAGAYWERRSRARRAAKNSPPN